MQLPSSTARRAASALAVGVAALVLAPPVAGAIVPGNGARSVQATADNGTQSLSDGASTLLPGSFDEDRLVEAFDPNAPAVLARGRASQSSVYDATSITAGGQATLTLGLAATTLAPTQAEATGRSSFVLEFTLDALSSYLLVGFVDTQATTTGGGSVPLLTNAVLLEALDTSTTVFETLTLDEGFSVSGQLGPGAYRISAFADVQALQASGATFRNVTGASQFSFDFVATSIAVPVSEPPPLPLVVTALLAAGLARRRLRPA